MKKFSRILALILSLSVIFSFTSLAADQAGEKSFYFDLNLEDKQTVTFINDAGEECTLTITPIDNPQLYSEDYLLIGDHAYKISLTTVAINLWYYIDVSHPAPGSAKINSAYDEDYLTLGCSVTRDSLTVNRSSETSSEPAKATYKVWVTFPGDLASSTFSLIASLKDGKLKVTTS